MLMEQCILNQGHYCSLHLRISCHLCQVDYSNLHDEANDSRESEGLLVGDPALTESCEEVSTLVMSSVFVLKSKVGMGQESLDDPVFRAEMKKEEARVNAAAEANCPTVSHCCFCCKLLGASPLQCPRCKTARYCSKTCKRARTLFFLVCSSSII